MPNLPRQWPDETNLTASGAPSVTRLADCDRTVLGTRLRDAVRFTRATTKREAVVKVLEEFNRRRRMAELVKYSGTFSDRFPTNDEIEAIDATRDRTLHARSRR